MRLLLPPSETKRPGGSGVFSPEALSSDVALGKARSQVRAALEELSRDPVAAARPLKLGVKNAHELEHNLRLGSSGARPAIERYTGVLYDALEVDTLSQAERSWLDDHALVQSALFGLIAASDQIPAYRFSASSRLPALGEPLKRVWAVAHRGLDWSGAGFVLDLRSKDYVALAPLPEGVGYFLNVTQRGPDGEVRALNHFNKAAKGDLVRRLARSYARLDSGEIESVDRFLEWAERDGLEFVPSEEPRTLTLVTELAPARRVA